MHYVLSAVRLAYDDKVILNTRPVAELAQPAGRGPVQSRDAGRLSAGLRGLERAGPDEARFEIARQIGSARPGLFKPDEPGASNSRRFRSCRTRSTSRACKPDLAADPTRPSGPGALAAGLERAVPVVARIHEDAGDRPCTAAILLQPSPPPGGRPTVAGPRLGGAADQHAALLVVFLRGAYDAANVVIPIGSDFYYRVAPDPRHRAGPNPASRQRGAGARRRLEPASGAEGDASIRCGSKARDRLRPLRRHRRSDAQPFRDPGHDRTGPAARSGRATTDRAS